MENEIYDENGIYDENKLNNETPKAKKKSKGGNLTFWAKVRIIIGLIFVFGILFFIMYRDSKINENFSEINGIKNSITKLQKENDQLEISIQSTLNLSNIEQHAKEDLGMQKLTSGQTINISIAKQDYIEVNDEALIEEDTSLWELLKEKISSLF